MLVIHNSVTKERQGEVFVLAVLIWESIFVQRNMDLFVK